MYTFLSYEDFKESQKDKKYLDGKHSCYICNKKPAYYELGDARFYAAGCEKCAHIQELYESRKSKWEKENKTNKLLNAQTEDFSLYNF